MTIEVSYTISEFCGAERISRAFLYKLWAKGKGPRYYLVGSVRRISHEARLEWHRQFEAEVESGEAAQPRAALEQMLEGSR